MKKRILVFLTALLLSILCFNTFATTIKGDITSDIELFLLDKNYNGIETDTVFNWTVCEFNIFEDEFGTINICANCDYYIFNEIQNSDKSIIEKDKAIKNIKKHMLDMVYALIKEYPDMGFRCWYESDYIDIKNISRTFKMDTCTNIYREKATKKIYWIGWVDSEWKIKNPNKSQATHT